MQHVVIELVWVALGSAAGGATRFLVSGRVARAFGETFPWGTMFVNVTGCLAIGALAAVARYGWLFHDPARWSALVTGFLGSYTTVSSFTLQTLALVRDGELRQARDNVTGALVLCLAAAAAGFVAADLALAAASR